MIPNIKSKMVKASAKHHLSRKASQDLVLAAMVLVPNCCFFTTLWLATHLTQGAVRK
jgi:hypothetical protein